MIRYAAVGTNWISRAMVKAARGTDLALCGVCSRTQARGRAFAEEIGRPELPVFVGAEELAAAPDIDAVYIASPNTCHAPQSELMLRAGKHVLCEKPIALCAEDCRRLQGLAREQGLVYMEAIMYLHTPARRAVLKALGELGEITAAHFDFSQLSSRYDELAGGGEIHNVFRPEFGGGALNDLGIYCVYPALDFFGAPGNIMAHAHALPTGVDGTGAAVFTYDGFDALLTFSKTGQSRGVSQILGTQGTITIRSVAQLQGVTLHDRQGNTKELAEDLQKHEVMRWEAQAFCDYVLGGNPAVSYEDAGALALRVCKGMERVRLKYNRLLAKIFLLA